MATGPARDQSSFLGETGDALRQALIAGYGPEAGAAAAGAVIAWGAARRERLESLENPTARLYRIGRRRARRHRGWSRQLPEVPDVAAPWIESAIPQVLAGLPRRQRVALLLLHGYGWSEAAAAGILGMDGSAIRIAVESGMTRLRSGLGSGQPGEARTLQDQIAAYAEVLDRAAPQLDELMAEVGQRAPRSEPWRAGAALMAVLAGLIVIVGVVVLRGNRSPTAVDGTGGSPTAAAAALPAVDVDLVNRSAITPETFADWEHQFAGPGAVAVVDGAYHMLSAAYGDDVATVALAISDDGVVWSQGADYPVLNLADAPWAPLEFDRATPRSVIVDGEGSWQLFFDIVWFDRGTDQLRSSIGRVVARDPTGTWIYDSEPIITRNGAYPWMAERVSSPSVVAREGGLVMVFVGEGPDGGVVGSAVSQDGAVWSVRPEPVYTTSGDWDGAYLSRVDLIAVPGGMAMVYAGESTNGRGLAVSADGVEWVPHPSNPLLTAADASAPSLFDTEFVPAGAGMLAYVETGRSRGPREVVVLRLDLDLPGLFPMLLGE